jgi:lysozyme
MAVDIDLSNVTIPGLPKKLEIKNAAQEETLKEILKVLEDTQKLAQQNLKAAKQAKDKSGPAAKAADAAAQAQNNAAKATNKNVSNMQKFGAATKVAEIATVKLANQLAGLGISSARLIKEFSNMGDSMTEASSSLARIPVVGSLLSATLGAVAGASQRVYGEFTKLASTGATFEGNMRTLVSSAAGAGLTLDQFTGILSQNGEALRLLGGTTEEGAKRFASLSKNMRASGVDGQLLRLGYSTQQINEGMASYIGIMGRTGRAQGIQNMSTEELTQQSSSYMKELDALAKITGSTRAEKQKEFEDLSRDAQFRAATLHLSEEERKEMMSFVNSFPKEAQGAVKDMISTGTASTDAAKKFAAMNSQSSSQIMRFGQEVGRGGAISKDRLNQAKKDSILEARSNEKRFKDLARFDTQYRETQFALSELARQDVDGKEKALSQQEIIAKQEATLAERIGKLQQDIAEISNNFTLALLDDAAIESLKKAFKAMAKFIDAFVVPIFKLVINILKPVITIFSTLANIVSTVLGPAFKALVSVAEVILIPVFTVLAAKVAFTTAKTIVQTIAIIAQTAAIWLNVAAQKASAAASALNGVRLRGFGNALRTVGPRIGLFGKSIAAGTAKVAVAGKGLATGLAVGGKAAAVALAGVAAPVTAVVAGVAAIGVGVYAVAKNWDKIVGFFSAVGKRIKNAFNSVVDWFKDIGKKIGGFFKGAWEKTKNWFKSKDSPEKQEQREKLKNQLNETVGKLVPKWMKGDKSKEPGKTTQTETYTVNGKEVDKETYEQQISGMNKLNRAMQNLGSSNEQLNETLEEANKLEEDAQKEQSKPATAQASGRNRAAAQTPGGGSAGQAPGSPSATGGRSTASAGGNRQSGGLGAAMDKRMARGHTGPGGAGAGAGGAEASGMGASDSGGTGKVGTGTKPEAVGRPSGGGGGMSEQEIKNMIIEHEGIRYKPYKDTEGLWTVGVGHLIGDGKSLPASYNREFSHEEVMAMFEKDYHSHRRAAERIPGFNTMNGRGQGAMTDLTFNMGNAWIKGWPKLQKQLSDGDMEAAAANLAGSKWATQVGRRAPIIVDHVRNGIQAAEGGMFSGPKSGYPATLHGDEAVIPLKDGNVPVEMNNANQSEMINLLSTLNSKMEQLVQLNAAIADLNNSQLKAQKKMASTDLLV